MRGFLVDALVTRNTSDVANTPASVLNPLE